MTSSTAQLEWLENTDRLPALDELYRATQPKIGKLPMEAGWFLAEDNTPSPGSEAEWNRKAEAALGLLTGKLNAAAYEAVVKPPLE